MLDGNAGWDGWQIADPRTIVEPEHGSLSEALATCVVPPIPPAPTSVILLRVLVS